MSGGLRHGAYGTLLHLGEQPLETVHGAFRAHCFQSLHTRRYAFAVAQGDLRDPEPLLARVHSSCVTSETYGACDCDCAEQLSSALATIARHGRGVLFYLMQEGRGAGFAAKARDRMLVQASRDRLTTFEAYEQMGLLRDYRRYEEVPFMRCLLDMRAPLRLLTSNPDKLAALERDGIEVAEVISLNHEVSPYNLHYIRAKRRSGHALDRPGAGVRPAGLPAPVTPFEPSALPEAPRFIHMARYLLPIRVPGSPPGSTPEWFTLSAYFDARESCERVVLCYGRDARATPLLRVQRERLIERFPLRGGGAARRAWRAAIGAMVRRGSGCALFLSAGGEGGGFPTDPGVDPARAEPDGALAALVARHLPGGVAQPLGGAGEIDAFFCRALAERGVATLDPEPLRPGSA